MSVGAAQGTSATHYNQYNAIAQTICPNGQRAEGTPTRRTRSPLTLHACSNHGLVAATAAAELQLADGRAFQSR